MKDIIVAHLDDLIAQHEAAGYSPIKITLSPEAYEGLLQASESGGDPHSDLHTYRGVALEHRELKGTRFIELMCDSGDVFFRNEDS